jgi:hypothetical protein
MDRGQTRAGGAGANGGAPMNQVSEDDKAGFVEISRLAVAATTLAMDDSDSPLAQAIRRRQRERDLPARVTAGHDSVI